MLARTLLVALLTCHLAFAGPLDVLDAPGPHPTAQVLATARKPTQLAETSRVWRKSSACLLSR